MENKSTPTLLSNGNHKHQNGTDTNGHDDLKKRLKLTEEHTDADKLDNEDNEQGKLKQIADSYLDILDAIGEDSSREGLLKTPSRAAKAMAFFTKGYKDDLKTIVKDACFEEGSDGIVIVKDIEFFSLCEHHMVFICFKKFN